MLFQIRNLLKIRQREKGYRLLIRSLQIQQGDRIAITGPSGCGKSTTLDILGLSLRPDSADKFEFDDGVGTYDVMGLWNAGKYDFLATCRLKNMGYVLQSGELLPFLSAGENMTLTARLSGMPDAEAEISARGLAEQLEIVHLWNARPATLSVGERQRAAIARAVAAHPLLILADEPTAALDPLHAAKVMDVFLSIIKEHNSTLVLVTHNAEWAIAGGLREIAFHLEENEMGVTAVLDGSANA